MDEAAGSRGRMVVAVAASAGSLPVLITLLCALPREFSAAVLVAHHQSATFTDADGTITDANLAAGTMLGCEPRSLVGRRLTDLLEHRQVHEAARHVRRARDGQGGEVILSLRRVDGTGRIVDARYRPLPSFGQDESRGAQWVLLDLELPLFEAEDRCLDDPGVARRWLSVYDELRAATEALVRDAEARAERLDQPARTRFEEAELRPLERRSVTIREGLRYWRRRYSDLIGLEIDLESPEVRYHGRTVQMTLRERQLLRTLLAHPGQTIPVAGLLLQAWHSSYLAEEQLRTYIVRLRRKLAELAVPCRLINRRGRGYALVFAEPGRP